MMLYKKLIRPVLFKFNGETAHHLAMVGLKCAGAIPGGPCLMRKVFTPGNAKAVEIGGLKFPSVLGVAGGFVKGADALKPVWGLGFGFIEVGSVSSKSWPGNPRPRVLRLVADEAMINWMGLPSQGWQTVRKSLEASRPPVPILVNVAKTGDPFIHGDAAVADIVDTVTGIAPVADWIVLNLSCPNTEDGRTFENDPDAMTVLLAAVKTALNGSRKLLVKLSPDKTPEQLSTLVDICMAAGVDGFVATNTTKTREGLLHQDISLLHAGGMSGHPLRDKSVATVAAVRRQVGQGPIIIGCGGIFNSGDAQMFLDAGANLLEGFTGFIYEGPFYCRNVLRDLKY